MGALSKTFAGTCVAALSLTGAVLVGGADAAPHATTVHKAGSANVASRAVSARVAADAKGYWTPRRMAHAKPVRVHPTSSAPITSGAAGTRVGKPVTVKPTLGSSGTTGSGIEPLSASAVPRPYTNAPDKMNVKVFFTKATGGNFVCSGTVVNSSTKRMVATAGHCVSDGLGRFHKNVVVVPAYASASPSNSSRPFGTWTARTLATTTEWHNFSNFKQDMGYIVLNDLGGKRIVNVVGGQGTKFNIARQQFFNSFGYPQAAPFNGLSQFVCPSARTADDNPTTRSGPLTLRISCNMTGGASGGGWLVNLSGSTGLGFVNSVNSYKYVSGPKANVNDMYGPYFGSQALSLFNFAVSLG